jgi:peptide deformylase
MIEIVKDLTVLKQVSAPFDFANPQQDAMELAKSLVKTMIDAGGIGLSAIQIGVPLRAISLRATPKNLVLFNPKIVHESKETQNEIEGCLSFPNLIMKVKRPFEVRVRYQLVDGTFKTDQWGGMTARVISHEIDHLDGKIFFERANRIHRERAFRQRDSIIRQLKSVA